MLLDVSSMCDECRFSTSALASSCVACTFFIFLEHTKATQHMVTNRLAATASDPTTNTSENAVGAGEGDDDGTRVGDPDGNADGTGVGENDG